MKTQKIGQPTSLFNEGPKHKQVLNALLLKRLFKLVQIINKSTGIEFEIQKGVDLKTNGPTKKNPFPLQIPIIIDPIANKEKISKIISHSPEHELLAYTMAVQVIEWAIKSIPKTKS